MSKKTYAVVILGLVCVNSMFGHRLGVYYYPWYGVPHHPHWDEGYLRNALIPKQPPELGEYASRDPVVIRRHINWCEQAGISIWVVSWWGKDTDVDTTVRFYLVPELNSSSIKFCIFYETVGLLGNSPNFDDPATREKFVSDVKYIAQTYFSAPSYLQIDNRHVLAIYLTRTFKGDIASAMSWARAAVDSLGYGLYLIADEASYYTPIPSRIELYDAITSYNWHGPSQYAGYPKQTGFLKEVLSQHKKWFDAAHSVNRYYIPNAMPGFNNLGAGGSAYIIPRQFDEGLPHYSTFRRSLITAKVWSDPGIDGLILITSWNEWHEDTQIEPTIVTSSTNRDTLGGYYTKGYYYKGYGEDNLAHVKWVLGDEYDLFFTGFEPGDPYPFTDSVIELANVTGPWGGPKPECGVVTQEMGVPVPAGTHYLRVAGEDTSSLNNSYCYFLCFNKPIPVDSGTFLSYLIYHYLKKHVAIDLYCTDGTKLRHLSPLDQNENPAYPEGRNYPLKEWLYVEVDLLPIVDKEISYISVGYDDNPNKETGNFRAYLDQIRIFTHDISVGQKEQNHYSVAPSLTIYPNPASHRVFFQTEEDVLIYDALGRFVNRVRFCWDGLDFRHRPVRSGVYFAITSGSARIRSSFVFLNKR
ncbi:hypothetical protein DRP53_07625 [candidate division WOR-3 bacterium]|uniref:T9SS type A sorting domain-containing protein n=1 Tax=candidate division WOR-3 bacterium TaxID=2052148 RepID=A0A660SGD6_UNCW3|nr:MAG: hypothetical protein DRP53_07625 [candidate division WOR-3 bacterium]